jgi:hypothetical protein
MNLCSKCVYYVEESGNKSYCENDYWNTTETMKAKLYNSYLFDCTEYEERERVVQLSMNESIKFA